MTHSKEKIQDQDLLWGAKGSNPTCGALIFFFFLRFARKKQAPKTSNFENQQVSCPETHKTARNNTNSKKLIQLTYNKGQQRLENGVQTANEGGSPAYAIHLRAWYLTEHIHLGVLPVYKWLFLCLCIKKWNESIYFRNR